MGGAGLQPCIYGPLGLAALAAEVHTVRNSGIASGAKGRMVAGFSAGLKACSTRFMNNPALSRFPILRLVAQFPLARPGAY